MTAPGSRRVNARLPPEVARKVAYLERRTRMTTTEVVMESIDRYYAAVSEGEQAEASELFSRAGFIACADGPADLSTDYKAELARSLGKKR